MCMRKQQELRAFPGKTQKSYLPTIACSSMEIAPAEAVAGNDRRDSAEPFARATYCGCFHRSLTPTTFKPMKIETLAVRAGHVIDPATGAVATPIYLSTTFER